MFDRLPVAQMRLCALSARSFSPKPHGLNFLCYPVVVAIPRLPTDQFPEETCKKQLGPDDHRSERDVKVGPARDQMRGRVVDNRYELNRKHRKKSYKTDEEYDRTE